jgi:hypothetical protein
MWLDLKGGAGQRRWRGEGREEGEKAGFLNENSNKF